MPLIRFSRLLDSKSSETVRAYPNRLDSVIRLEFRIRKIVENKLCDGCYLLLVSNHDTTMYVT